MSVFGGTIFTNRGKALQAKAQTGVPLVFTRLSIGDGSLGGQSIAELTSLIHEVKTISINKLETLSGGKATVGGVFNNQGLSTGFYWRELGLFATDPDLGEILYCYGNAGGLAEYIPAGGGADILEKQVNIVALIGNASSVSATIDQSLVYATQTDVIDLQQQINDKADQSEVDAFNTAYNAHLADYVRQPGYAVTTGSANTYVVSTSPAPAAYIDGMGIVIRVHTANTGASTINWNGLGAKNIVDSKGNPLAAGKLPAGSRISLRYSTAAGNFQLQGEGGEYGTATASDVLSGKSIGTDDGIVTGTMANYDSGYSNVQDGSDVLAATQNATVGRFDLDIPDGYHTRINAHILGAISSNIKAGAKLGHPTDNTKQIIGTFTSDANAETWNVLANNTYYKNGQKYTGTMTLRDATPGGVAFTPSTSDQNYGGGCYFNGFTVKGDPDLVSTNIKQGVNIFGVDGMLIPKTNEKRWAKGNCSIGNGAFSVTGLAFTPSFVFVEVYTGARYYFALSGNGAFWTPGYSLSWGSLQFPCETYHNTAGMSVYLTISGTSFSGTFNLAYTGQGSWFAIE